jgi:hypothetical protein
VLFKESSASFDAQNDCTTALSQIYNGPSPDKDIPPMSKYIFYSLPCIAAGSLFAHFGGDLWVVSILWFLIGVTCLGLGIWEYQDAAGQRRRLKHRKNLITSSVLSEADWNEREKANRAACSGKLRDADRVYQQYIAEKRSNVDRFYRLYLAGIRQHDAERIDAYLQKLSDSYLHLFDGMPPVKAKVIDRDPNRPIDEPYLATGGNGVISIRKDYFDSASFHSLVKVIKHEMTHCWINWKGIQMSDPHGPEFQRKLAEVS